MNLQEIIEKRRSIRAFEKRDVPEDVIKQLLEAARLAPSAHNIQSWRYFIVNNFETRKKLHEAEAFNQEFVYDAPVILVCCADLAGYPKPIKGWDNTPRDYGLIDLTIATQTLS